MKAIKHPIPKTIAYGLICGLTLVPLSLTLNAVFGWSNAVGLTFWLFLAGYAILLIHWSNKALVSIVFPLLLLVPAIFLSGSLALFFFLAVIVLSWIRSGICFQEPGAGRLAVELLLFCLVSVPVWVFTPGSMFTWALAAWLFFLVQAIYFAFFEHSANLRGEPVPEDSFERASRQAERILTDACFH